MTNDPTTISRVGTSYVEWAPIFAGAIAAAALSFVLLTAGATIGLSLVSPYPSQSYGIWVATLATAWVLIVTIGSFLVGGYIAGRLRLTWGEGNADEVEFRDGIHGFLVWSLSIFIGGVLALIAGTTTTLVGAEVGKSSVYSSERATVLASWRPLGMLLSAVVTIEITTFPLNSVFFAGPKSRREPHQSKEHNHGS